MLQGVDEDLLVLPEVALGHSTRLNPLVGSSGEGKEEEEVVVVDDCRRCGGAICLMSGERLMEYCNNQTRLTTGV